MPSTLSAAALVLLASSASAYPSLRWNSLSRRQDAHPYIAPGATDGMYNLARLPSLSDTEEDTNSLLQVARPAQA